MIFESSFFRSFCWLYLKNWVSQSETTKCYKTYSNSSRSSSHFYYSINFFDYTKHKNLWSHTTFPKYSVNTHASYLWAARTSLDVLSFLGKNHISCIPCSCSIYFCWWFWTSLHVNDFVIGFKRWFSWILFGKDFFGLCHCWRWHSCNLDPAHFYCLKYNENACNFTTRCWQAYN